MAIASLRTAVRMLKKKYEEFDKQDARDLKGEQAEAMKAKPAASLAHVADDVAKALKTLPTSAFNLALTGETGAILQGFLSRPEVFFSTGSKHAGLTQTGSQLAGEPAASGRAILGILESLMETFTANLAAMQDKEKLGISTFSSTKTAKESQVSAMESTISTKESQLAHYTTMNAQAKEDLAYLRETNIFDIQYLRQTREQCAASENEFQVRKKTRQDEIAALAEGISILTAGGGASASSASATQPAATSSNLIHTDRHVKRVFARHHDSAKKRAVLKIAAPKAAKAVNAKSSLVTPKLVIAATPAVKANVAPSFVQVSRSTDSPFHRTLAALTSEVRLANRRLAVGPLTSSAINQVISQVDVVVVQLQTQKKMEIKKKETCVKEKVDATEQRQRRVTDKAKT